MSPILWDHSEDYASSYTPPDLEIAPNGASQGLTRSCLHLFRDVRPIHHRRSPEVLSARVASFNAQPGPMTKSKFHPGEEIGGHRISHQGDNVGRRQVLFFPHAMPSLMADQQVGPSKQRQLSSQRCLPPGRCHRPSQRARFSSRQRQRSPRRQCLLLRHRRRTAPAAALAAAAAAAAAVAPSRQCRLPCPSSTSTWPRQGRKRGRWWPAESQWRPAVPR